jgi:hypothetical protein
MRLGKPKKQEASDVIVSATTKTEMGTIAEERDDSQLMVLTAIAAFGAQFPLIYCRKSISRTGPIREKNNYITSMIISFEIPRRPSLRRFYFWTGRKRNSLRKMKNCGPKGNTKGQFFLVSRWAGQSYYSPSDCTRRIPKNYLY